MHAVSAKELAEVRGTLVQRHAQDVAMLPLPDEKQVRAGIRCHLQLIPVPLHKLARPAGTSP